MEMQSTAHGVEASGTAERSERFGQLAFGEGRLEGGLAEEQLVLRGGPERDDLVEQFHVLEPAAHLPSDLLDARRRDAQSREADVRVLKPEHET